LVETADFGNDAQFMVFVRYRATENYVNNLSCVVHLSNVLQEKQCLRK